MPLSSTQRRHLYDITDTLRLINIHAFFLGQPNSYKDFSASNQTVIITRRLVSPLSTMLRPLYLFFCQLCSSFLDVYTEFYPQLLPIFILAVYYDLYSLRATAGLDSFTTHSVSRRHMRLIRTFGIFEPTLLDGPHRQGTSPISTFISLLICYFIGRPLS